MYPLLLMECMVGRSTSAEAGRVVQTATGDAWL